VLFARGREIARRVELCTEEELSGFVDRALEEVPPPDADDKSTGDEAKEAGESEGKGAASPEEKANAGES
jgi:hypothetical protein